MIDVKEQVNRVEYIMTKVGLQFSCAETEAGPAIALQLRVKAFEGNYLTVVILFEDGMNSFLMSEPITFVLEERIDDVLRVLNRCNQRYRRMKFYLDGNAVVARCNVDLFETNAARACLRAVTGCALAVNDAYPDIMEAAWGNW